ncbi:antitoxin family protein [Thermococcus atlanticus]
MEIIEVVYENGVFRPLKKIKLKEGTRARVILNSPKGLLEIIRKYQKKVDTDVLEEFLEERR